MEPRAGCQWVSEMLLLLVLILDSLLDSPLGSNLDTHANRADFDVSTKDTNWVEEE